MYIPFIFFRKSIAKRLVTVPKKSVGTVDFLPMFDKIHLSLRYKSGHLIFWTISVTDMIFN